MPHAVRPQATPVRDIGEQQWFEPARLRLMGRVCQRAAAREERLKLRWKCARLRGIKAVFDLATVNERTTSLLGQIEAIKLSLLHGVANYRQNLAILADRLDPGVHA